VGKVKREERREGEGGRGIEFWFMGPVPTYRINIHKYRSDRGNTSTEVSRGGTINLFAKKGCADMFNASQGHIVRPIE
jgi:hypothetical protein